MSSNEVQLDPYGYYAILRVSNRRRGEKLNVGVIAFWAYGWSIKVDSGALSRAAAAFPELDEFAFQEWADDLPAHLGLRTPGDFNPYESYFRLHQFRQHIWAMEGLEFSTLRRITIGEVGQFGFAGGVEEAAEHLLDQVIRPGEVPYAE